MEYNLTKVEELFGTLQQSVVSTWRKHLKTTKYSLHMALDEFYKEMPEKVDKLIEDYIGAHDNLEEYVNILDGKEMDALEYLNAIHDICKAGRQQFLEGDSALESDMDDILSFIDGVIYKVRQLTEGFMSLKSYLKMQVEDANVTEGNISNVERKWREFCGMCRAYNVEPESVTVCKTSKNNWRVCVDGKKKFLVSRYILDDDLIKEKGLKVEEVVMKPVEEPAEETKTE